MTHKMSVGEGSACDGRTWRNHNDEKCCAGCQDKDAEATEETKYQHEHKPVMMRWATVQAEDMTCCCRTVVPGTQLV